MKSQALSVLPFLPPPPGVEHLAFGFKESMADSFWVRAVQDFDYCEKEIKPKQCRAKGWLFQILDTATNLSPKFEIAYEGGGLALSVLVGDIPGASALFDKGVKEFPHSIGILTYAAQNAAFEEGDYAKGAKYLIMAADSGGPSWFYSLAQNLYLKHGQRALAEATLADLKRHPEENAQIIERLEDRLALFDKEGYTPKTANPALRKHPETDHQ